MNINDLKEKYNIDNLEYYEILKDLLKHSKVIEMNNYIQYGTTTTLSRSIKL